MKRKHKNVLLAIPAYTGMVHCGTMRSVMHDLVDLINEGHQVQVIEEIGNAEIARCRAGIVSRFLARKDSTHLIMIDSDVCWESFGLRRLLNANVDFAAAAYPMRTGEGTKYHLRMMAGEVQSLSSNGLLEVEAVPAGFVCLSRSMLERMCEAYADLKFSFREVPGGVAYGLFDAEWETDDTGLRHKLGEDYSFCKRWRKLGGRIYVDPQISMGHLGTKLWQGRLADKFAAPPSEAAA